MKDVRVDIIKNEVVMTSKFADKASDPRAEEYRILQDIIKTYPNIKVRKHTIKKNPYKECYKGLTYNYMREYILTHEVNPKDALAEFDEMLLISKCHSDAYRYPTIKKWFLDRYEEVKCFGIANPTEDRTNNPELIAELLEVA